jgi:hypothetical protein
MSIVLLNNKCKIFENQKFLPFSLAASASVLKASATSSSSGSSKLASLSSDWMETSTALICSAGLQFFLRISKQILPKRLAGGRTEFVDVRVVNLGPEEHLRRDHRVLVGQEQLCLEQAAEVRSVCRARDLDVEVSEVVFVWSRVDSDNYSGASRRRQDGETESTTYLGQTGVVQFPIDAC